MITVRTNHDPGHQVRIPAYGHRDFVLLQQKAGRYSKQFTSLLQEQ